MKNNRNIKKFGMATAIIAIVIGGLGTLSLLLSFNILVLFLNLISSGLYIAGGIVLIIGINEIKKKY